MPRWKREELLRAKKSLTHKNISRIIKPLTNRRDGIAGGYGIRPYEIAGSLAEELTSEKPRERGLDNRPYKK